MTELLYNQDESMNWLPDDLRTSFLSTGEFMSQQSNPIQWVMPGLGPEGLNIVGALPKIGKTVLTVDWSIGVALGERLMGIEGYEPVSGRTLYIELDDTSVARNQARIMKRLGYKSLEELAGKGLPSNFNITTKWDYPYDGTKKSLTPLRRIVDSSPIPVRMITIDTLAKFLPGYREDQTAYQTLIKLLPALRVFANDYHIAVNCLVHTKKHPERGSDWTTAFYGSVALLGEADNLIGMFEDPEAEDNHRYLMTRGRDLDEARYDLDYDRNTNKASIRADNQDLPELQANIARQAYKRKETTAVTYVRDFLGRLPADTALLSSEIQELFFNQYDIPKPTVRGALRELAINKELDMALYGERRSRYRLASEQRDSAAIDMKSDGKVGVLERADTAVGDDSDFWG